MYVFKCVYVCVIYKKGLKYTIKRTMKALNVSFEYDSLS